MKSLLAVAFLFLSACGSSAELVVVTVHGDRSGVATLDALVTLDGTMAMKLESFSPGTTDFGIELPDGAEGALEISVAGVDDHSCIVSIGLVDSQAGGRDRLDLTVTLSTVSPPKCPPNP